MKKSRICWIRILFPVFAILLFSVFLLTIKVNAASDQDYFPMSQNKNSKFPSAVISKIETQFNSENNYIFAYYQKKQNSYNVIYVAYFPKNSDLALYGEKNNDLIHFSLYKYGTGSINCRQFLVENSGYVGGVYESSLSSFQNLVSSNYSNTIDYVSNFQLYTDNSNTKKIVLLYDDGVTIPEDNTARDDTEKPNVLNYFPDWSTPPSFDNSSVENALNSVFNIISWLSNNLFTTIKGLGNYIVDSLMWGLQMVINNIRGKLQEVKNSIDSIVAGIGDLIDSKFGNIITIASTFFALGLDQGGNFSLTQMFTSLFVPSSQQIIQAVLDHDDFDFIGTSKVVIADAPRILSQLYNVTSTPIFHVPSCTFHGVEIGNFDVSFAWFAPYKVYYDVIVSTFLVIGYIYWIFISMHGHIRTTYTPGPQEEEYWRY